MIKWRAVSRFRFRLAVAHLYVVAQHEEEEEKEEEEEEEEEKKKRQQIDNRPLAFVM